MLGVMVSPIDTPAEQVTKAVRLDSDLAEKCEQWCEANESDFSKLARLALRRFLEREALEGQ
jgi:predicted transcriptional regulator